MDIIGKRYLYFGISIVLIIPGLIALAMWGLPLAVDFSGGSLVEVRIESGPMPSLQAVRDLYTEHGIPDAEPRSSEGNILMIRTEHIDDATNRQILTAMETEFGVSSTLLRFDSVGPTVSREVASRAAGAVALASVFIMIYIWYAFRGVRDAHRYGISAIIAMLHDVALVFGMQAIISHFWGWEVDALFLTALLTVIGFSVHDSIVVFDRIRENESKNRRESYATVVNRSVVQTMARSINTQLTIFLTLMAMFLFGGSTIRHFILIMIIGLVSGTYSSIFNASPILVVWHNREWEHWFRRKKRPAQA